MKEKNLIKKEHMMIMIDVLSDEKCPKVFVNLRISTYHNE
jgi:hypothetical protein